MRLGLVVLAMLTFGCCKARTDSVPKPPDSLGGILRIIGKFPIAHACPIGPEWALTNAHVADNPRPPVLWREESTLPVRWSDREGNEGVAVSVPLQQYADLDGLVPVGKQFAQWYSVAKEPPKPGDHVRFLGYDWSSRKAAFAELPFETTVTRVVAGHVVYFDAGKPGSSGSCVLNDKDEVVAVNAWGKEVGPASDEVGVGVGVWPVPGLR